MVLNTLDKRLNLLVVIDNVPLDAWRKKIIERVSVSSGAETLQVYALATSLSKVNRLCSLHLLLDRKYFKPRPDAFELDKNTHVAGYLIQQIKSTEEILSQAFDYIIWLSDQSPAEAFLEKLARPMIVFVHGNHNDYDSRLFAYQSFYNKKEVLTSALIYYHSKQFKVIERTWSMLKSMSLSRSRNEHFWKISGLLPRAIEQLARTNKRLEWSSSLIDLVVSPDSTTTTISNRQVMQCLWNHSLRFGAKVWRKIHYREQWILLLKMQKGITEDFQDFKKIFPPKDVFWADPFLVENNDRQFLFFEELPFSTWKGHLCVAEIDSAGNLSESKKILELDYHLSYPFVFNVDDRFYMIPESYEAGNIQLYEATDFPYQWQHKMDLMTGVRAFDTTLYFHRGKWWLFTVLAQEGSGHNDELFLFYADTLFTTDWTSHPKNPIVSDVRRARPAGRIYEENGKLIRPSQDCGRKYGYGFHLNEIEILSETDYREKSILHVRPDGSKLFTRTHSFNQSSKATVIDAAIQRSRFF